MDRFAVITSPRNVSPTPTVSSSRQASESINEIFSTPATSTAEFTACSPDHSLVGGRSASGHSSSPRAQRSEEAANREPGSRTGQQRWRSETPGGRKPSSSSGLLPKNAPSWPKKMISPKKHNGIIGEMNSRTTNYDALVERLKELAKTSKTSSTR